MKRKAPKCLITAGCSFSQVPNSDITWPVHLCDILQPTNVYFLGQGAAGNGIISRKVIYHTTQALKIYKPEEILVGIMWSGRDRQEVYSTDPNFPHHDLESTCEGYRNPVRIADEYNFYLMNAHWDDDATTNYIKNYYDEVGAYLISIEHILRTQWFLKQYNIPYFMTEYSVDCLPTRDITISQHSDISYLLDLIDKNAWIEIDNMWQFAMDSGVPFARPPDPHPATEHHFLFTRDKVMVHLHKRGIVSL
jgi:hypothetical protein